MEQSKRLRYSIILLSSYTFAWMTLGWIFWVLGGCKAIMPFISDLDLYQPGDTIFTLGAIGSSFLAIWFLFELQNTRSRKYLTFVRDRRFTKDDGIKNGDSILFY